MRRLRLRRRRANSCTVDATAPRPTSASWARARRRRPGTCSSARVPQRILPARGLLRDRLHRDLPVVRAAARGSLQQRAHRHRSPGPVHRPGRLQLRHQRHLRRDQRLPPLRARHHARRELHGLDADLGATLQRHRHLPGRHHVDVRFLRLRRRRLQDDGHHQRRLRLAVLLRAAAASRRTTASLATPGGECLPGSCAQGVGCATNCAGPTSVRADRHGRHLHQRAGRTGSAEPVQISASLACGTDGVCNGAGACRCTRRTQCVAASCTGTTFTPARTCNGPGTCQRVTSSSCAP